MKIIYLASASSIHIERIVKYFSEKGHEVHLISFENPNSSLKDIHLHYVGFNNPILRLIVEKLIFIQKILVKRKVKKIQPDILHAHYISYYGIVGSRIDFHPFIVSAWGSDVLIDSKGRKRKYIIQALKKADYINCSGYNTYRAIIELGIHQTPIQIIRFGVDIRLFHPNQNSIQLKSEKFKNIIISTRNFAPVYDIQSLIHAIPYVLKFHSRTKLILLGYGPQKDELERLVKELHMNNNIEFGGYISNDQLPRYLAAADIYVSPALSDESISVSIGEAMACSLPVIITDIGENRKWVKDYENGFIVATKSPEEIAEKIVFLLNNPHIKDEYGKKNRQIIESNFNFTVEMEKLEKLYCELKDTHQMLS